MRTNDIPRERASVEVLATLVGNQWQAVFVRKRSVAGNQPSEARFRGVLVPLPFTTDKLNCLVKECVG